MQFNRKKLIAAVRAMVALIPKRTVQPILACCVVTCEAVRATDLDHWLTIDIEAVHTKGEVWAMVTPAKVLLQILQGTTGDTVDIDRNGEEYTVCGIKIQTFDICDYPTPPPRVELSASHKPQAVVTDLAEALKCTMFAAASYEGNSILSGIAWKGQELAATDGSRLSWFHSRCATELDCIIPVTALQHVAKFIKDDTHVTVNQDSHRVELEGDGWMINIRLIPGEYPRYLELYPHPEKGAMMTFRRKDMLDKMSTLKLTLDERTNLVKFDENQVMSTSAYVGEEQNTTRAEMRIDVAPGDGAPAVLPFQLNYNYLRQALESLEGETVHLQWTGQLKPLVFREGGYNHLVMPVQFKDEPLDHRKYTPAPVKTPVPAEKPSKVKAKAPAKPVKTKKTKEAPAATKKPVATVVAMKPRTTGNTAPAKAVQPGSVSAATKSPVPAPVSRPAGGKVKVAARKISAPPAVGTTELVTGEKSCPKCGKDGDIATVFGYRTIRPGKTIPQSYCRKCR